MKRTKYTTESFIEKCRLKHGNSYDYSKFIFVNTRTKGIIFCNKCQKEFLQTPQSHLIMNQQCPHCNNDNRRKSIKKFIEQAKIKHNNFYNYEKSIYLNKHTKIIIICSSHGEFLQTPHNHLHGNGCPKCGYNTSKVEIAWLNYLGVLEEFRQKIVEINGRWFKPDAIDQENKIIWEFYGNYFHGNPNNSNPEKINHKNKRTFGEMYQKTIERKNFLEEAGYKVIYIWQSDFRHKNTLKS